MRNLLLCFFNQRASDERLLQVSDVHQFESQTENSSLKTFSQCVCLCWQVYVCVGRCVFMKLQPSAAGRLHLTCSCSLSGVWAVSPVWEPLTNRTELQNLWKTDCESINPLLTPGWLYSYTDDTKSIQTPNVSCSEPFNSTQEAFYRANTQNTKTSLCLQ